MHLSDLLGRSLATGTGDAVARIDDVIVRLRGEQYPLVTGVLARLERRAVFVPTKRIEAWTTDPIVLPRTTLDLQTFERREGEVLLRADILGHRLIDVARAELVQAFDIELDDTAEGLAVSCLDTRRSARLLGLCRHGAGHPCRDWKSFEPLLGHTPGTLARGGRGRVRRLKAAQIAHLLESANRDEGQEILSHVHADPELEADVFEELHPDTTTRLFADRSDRDVADILGHMRSDDAADGLADLPQRRRQLLLDAMPLAQRTKVLTLMGFTPASAGGRMNLDVLSVPADADVAQAPAAVRVARAVQPEALNTVHAVDAAQRLRGVAALASIFHDVALVDAQAGAAGR